MRRTTNKNKKKQTPGSLLFRGGRESFQKGGGEKVIKGWGWILWVLKLKDKPPPKPFFEINTQPTNDF